MGRPSWLLPLPSWHCLLTWRGLDGTRGQRRYKSLSNRTVGVCAPCPRGDALVKALLAPQSVSSTIAVRGGGRTGVSVVYRRLTPEPVVSPFHGFAPGPCPSLPLQPLVFTLGGSQPGLCSPPSTQFSPGWLVPPAWLRSRCPLQVACPIQGRRSHSHAHCVGHHTG